MDEYVFIAKDHSIIKPEQSKKLYLLVTGMKTSNEDAITREISLLPGIIGRVRIEDLSIIDLIMSNHTVDAIWVYRYQREIFHNQEMTLTKAHDDIYKIKDRLVLSFKRNKYETKVNNLDKNLNVKNGEPYDDNCAILYKNTYFYQDEITNGLHEVHDLYEAWKRKYEPLVKERKHFLEILRNSH